MVQLPHVGHSSFRCRYLRRSTPSAPQANHDARLIRVFLLILLVAANSGAPFSPHATSATQQATPVIGSSVTWLTHRGNAARTGTTDTVGPVTEPVQRWGYWTGNSISDQPLVFGGLVLAAHGVGSLMALHLATGEEAWWVYPGENGPRATTLSEDGITVVKDRDARLYAYDILTGTHLWTVDGLGFNDPGPVVDGVLYSAGEGDTLHAIDVHTGTSLWSVVLAAGIDENDPSGVRAASMVGLPGPRPAAVDDGILTIASTEGRVSAVDLVTHEVLWTASCDWPEDTGDVPARSGDIVVDTPVMADGMVYVSCNWEIQHPGPGTYGIYELVSGGLITFDARTGDERWRFQTERRAGLRSPAVAGDALYTVSTHGGVYALSAEEGTVLWQAETGSPSVAPPTVGGALLYIADTDGAISAYNAVDGSLHWKFGRRDSAESPRGQASGPYGSEAGVVVLNGLLILASGPSVVVLGDP